MTTSSTSRAERPVVQLPPQPPIDPLDVFVALQARLFPKKHKKEKTGKARESDHYVPPIIDANRGTMPALFDFSRRTDTGSLADEYVAALYVCVRLFGDEWQEYAPPICNKRWIASVNKYRERSAPPCPAELLEISRVFRVFLRPDSATLQWHKRKIAAFIEQGQRFSGEAFNASKKADSYRVSLFLYALRASGNVDSSSKDRFLAFVRQNSFIRRNDAASLRRMIDADDNVDPVSLKMALRCFRLKKSMR